jgi:hypothetical protein
MQVKLTPAQCQEACAHAVAVRCKAVLMQRHGVEGYHNGDNHKRFESNACGFEAELAVSVGLRAIGFDAPWVKLMRAAGADPDCGENVQVRWTRHRDGGLAVSDSDPQHVYVLVTGRKGEYELRGWATYAQAMRAPLTTFGRPGARATHLVPRERLCTDWAALPVKRLEEETT